MSLEKNKKIRIMAIDILRGFAMVLVILQHSYLLVDRKLIPPVLDQCIWLTTNMAAVAFVSVSGVMYSYFFYLKTDWQRVYKRYAARALLLILAVNPIIMLASYPFRKAGNEGSFELSLLNNFGIPITDTIGVCMLLAPVFLLRISQVIRATLIFVFLLIAPFIASFPMDVDNQWIIGRDFLFGGIGAKKTFWWPLLPWLSIFLSGSFISEKMVHLIQGKIRLGYLIRQLNLVGTKLMGLCVFLLITYKSAKILLGGRVSHDLFRAIYPAQTTGLLPGYFAILLWLFAALVILIDLRGHYNRIFWFLSIFGRTSLFTFVIQFAVIESIPAMFGLKGVLGPKGFFSLFVIGSGAIWLLSYGYGRFRGWFSGNDYTWCKQAAVGQRAKFRK